MTNSVKTRPLSIEQENAIELLLCGKSDREVAEAVGVTRQTVWEWRNRNPEFIAALNARRQEVWGSHVERLRQLVTKAIDVLEENLDGKAGAKLQQEAAVHILRAVGLYGADLTPKGETSAENVEKQMTMDELYHELMTKFR